MLVTVLARGLAVCMVTMLVADSELCNRCKVCWLAVFALLELPKLGAVESFEINKYPSLLVSRESRAFGALEFSTTIELM